MSSSVDPTASLAPPLARSRWLRLTPLDRRRFANFRANGRGYWSFWLFLLMFVMSLLSNILANDRPVLAWYKGELLFPAFVAYPEEKFGGFLARTDYRDPVIATEINAHGWMVWPPDAARWCSPAWLCSSWRGAMAAIPRSPPSAPPWRAAGSAF